MPGWWALVGAGLFAAGLYALIADIERWNVLWYAPAWYGYLLVLDAFIFMLQGHSFLTHRRRELLEMMFWSVPYWYLFEAYNFVIQNWYYVFILRTDWLQCCFSFLAFATVLPACFMHAEFVKALGWWRAVRWRPLRVTPGLLQCLGLFGLACILLPLLLPRYAFWLVWGATFGLPELLNYRSGAPSLLRDLEQGRPRRVLCLLTGGLMAGFVWESLNFWARCKWIYTVPGLEELKLFEMPLLGFLGFPVLAIEAFSFYSMLSHWLRGGRSWEAVEQQGVRPVPRVRYALAAVVAILLSFATFEGVMHWSVRSRRPLLIELNGLDGAAVERLVAAGVSSTERLYAEVRRFGVDAVAAEAELELERVAESFEHATLALHKGMGAAAARLLIMAGVPDVAALVDADADALHSRLTQLARGQGTRPPRLAEVKVWIRAATRAGVPRR
jgi:hypothetical protein